MHGLQKTIDSVISQTCKAFEWIIIDGGSTDGSKNLIELYKEYFSYWCSEPDKGIYNAMNKGIKKASGEYCLFLNSGDRLHGSDVIEKVLIHLKDTTLISGDEWWVNEQYQFIKENRNPNELTNYHLLVGILWHQCTFIKRKVFDKHPYDENLKIAGDWEQMFYEFVINGGSYKHIDLIVSDFTVGGMSERNWSLLSSERKKVRDKYLSQREQDEMSLEHLSQRNDDVSRRKMLQIAYTAFANKYYSQKEYIDLFGEYKNLQIMKGIRYQSFFVKMTLIGHMKLAYYFYSLMTYLIKKR